MATTSKILEATSGPLIVPEFPTVPHFLFDQSNQANSSSRLFYNDTTSLTHKDVVEKSVLLARKWKQSQWVKSGDVVVILSPSNPEFIVAVFALHLLGCVVSPCNPLVKPEEFATQLKQCKASKVIAATSSIHIARAALKETGVSEVEKHIVIMAGSSDGVPTLESLTEDSTNSSFDPSEWTDRESTAFIVWSSGTSGAPKALALSHTNLIANILQFEALLGDRFNNYSEGRTDEVHLDVLPQFHAYGLITTLLAFYSFTPRFVMERFDADRFAEISQRDKVTFSMLVPPAHDATVLALAKKPSIKPEQLATVRSIASGAAALPQDIRDKLKEKFDIIVTDGYGCTECSPIISAQKPQHVLAGKSGVGPIAPGLSVRIVDVDSEDDLGRNEAGEIRVKGPNVFSGYLGNEEVTAASFDPYGYYKTGDIGILDDDGHIRITDRAKDLIKYNGFQVSVSELEALLISHPAVGDAAVIGVYDEAKATELPKAFAVATPSYQPSEELTKEIITFVNDRVANYKKLRAGLEWIDAIPKNPSGKILRRVLRAQAVSPQQLKEKPSDCNTVAEQEKSAVKGPKKQGAKSTIPKSPSTNRSVRGKKMDGFSNMLLMMDEKSYHAACFSIYTFAEDVSYDVIHNFFSELVKAFPKYSQVVINRNRSFSPAQWIDHSAVEASKDWKLEDNIHEINLPARANGRNALFNEAGNFVAQHFDFRKPVWEALLVHNVNPTEYNGCAALMIKIHHCFSDGQGMIQSYHSALHAINHDVSVGAVQKDADAKQAKAKKDNTKTTFAATHNHAWHTVRRLFITGRRNTFAYTESRRQPRPEGRIYAHSKGVALSDLALVRKAFSTDKYKATLNDVVCAITAIAFRRHASKQTPDHEVKDRSVAFLIPMSFRPENDWNLENYSSGGIAWFNWGKHHERDFQSVLIQVHKEMRMIKRSKFPAWGLSIFRRVLKYPVAFQPRWPVLGHVYTSAYKQYHIMTNVPGPSKAVKFGGVEATSYHVLPPSSPGKGSMAIGLISYDGTFSIAMTCDRVSEFRTLPIDLCASFESVAAEVVAEATRKLKEAETSV